MKRAPGWTLYCHTHTESGRRYIGLTKKTMAFRWNQHLQNAKAKRGKGCAHFWNAIRKYGKDAFSHEVLEVCHSLEVANLAEECWIEFYDTTDPEKGFNIKKGGGHTPHPIKNPWDRPGFREKAPSTIHHCHTPEARAKQRASLTLETRSAATKAAMARPDVKAKHALLHQDPEHRQRISAATKAALADPEVKKRVSDGIRAAWQDPEARERIVAGVRRALARPEVKERHRSAVTESQNRPEVLAKRRAYRASDETKARISASSTGRLHSPESVERQRQLYLDRSSRCRFCDTAIDGKRSCVRGRVACLNCYGLHKAKLASFVRPDGSFVGQPSSTSATSQSRATSVSSDPSTYTW